MKSCYSELVGKSVDEFKRKSEFLKNYRLDSEGMLAKQNKAVLEASYPIAFSIAQAKKPHTNGEVLIQHYLFEASTLVLGGKKPIS